MKNYRIICILFTLLSILFTNSTYLQAEKISVAKKQALWYGSKAWGENIKLGDWIEFLHPTDGLIAYMFCINKDKNDMTNANDLFKKVEKGRALRLKGEEKLKLSTKDAELQDAQKMIDDGWREMLDEANFGTVVTLKRGDSFKPLEIYDGLPLNYVAMIDAQEIASSNKMKNMKLKKYLFTGVLEYYAIFEDGDDKCLVDLSELAIVDDQQSAKELLNYKLPDYDDQIEPDEMLNNESLHKPQDVPDLYVKIYGVPDYWHSGGNRRCAQFASACVLGYWDDRGGIHCL
ncbi:hypothetical protein JW960_10720 [candidate division KSB1 bacterium]|nr:hypothetical protein [candidate division KSB1 bacterium]